jgi:hypothetical protein
MVGTACHVLVVLILIVNIRLAYSESSILPSSNNNDLTRHTIVQLGHEASSHIVVEFFSPEPTLFLGTGIQTPEFALADTNLQQLMSPIVNGEIEFVKQHAIRQSLLGLDEFGVARTGEFQTQCLDVTQDGDRFRRGLDRGTADFNVFGRIDQILPFQIVRAHFAFEFVPSRRYHETEAAGTVLEGFQQTTVSCDDARSLFGGDSHCCAGKQEGRRDGSGGDDTRCQGLSAGHGICTIVSVGSAAGSPRRDRASECKYTRQKEGFGNEHGTCRYGDL